MEIFARRSHAPSMRHGDRASTRRGLAPHEAKLAWPLLVALFHPLEVCMPSKNVGSKRRATNDKEVPAELSKREAQDRPKGSRGGQAKSPVDSMHVDAPTKQENARGRKAKKG